MVVAAPMGASAPPPQGGMTRWQVHGDVHLTTPSLVGMAQEQGQCWGAGPSLMGAAHPPCHPISLVRRQPVGRLPQGLGSGLQPLRVQPGRHAAGRAGHPRVGQRDAGNAQRWAQGWRCLPLPGAAWAHPRGSPQHIPCCSPRCSPDAAALPNSLASLSASMLSRLHPSIYPLPCPPVHHRRVCCSVPVHSAVSAASPQCSATVIVASLLSLVHFLTPVHPCCLCCTPPPPMHLPISSALPQPVHLHHYRCFFPTPVCTCPPSLQHHPSAAPLSLLHLPMQLSYLCHPQCVPASLHASPLSLCIPSAAQPALQQSPLAPLHPLVHPSFSFRIFPVHPSPSACASQLFSPRQQGPGPPPQGITLPHTQPHHVPSVPSCVPSVPSLPSHSHPSPQHLPAAPSPKDTPPHPGPD